MDNKGKAGLDLEQTGARFSWGVAVETKSLIVAGLSCEDLE
jgi:hypothetical protein